VAVIDLDVHQGNGTAAIFRDDPTVFTLSLHGAEELSVPQGGQRSWTWTCPTAVATTTYLQALDQALDRPGNATAPSTGLVFYLAGADPHEGDRLGRLKLTLDGLAERDRGCSTGLAAAAFRWPW
jgi:acetoin utilization deacetylase AcuC-like enzyme